MYRHDLSTTNNLNGWHVMVTVNDEYQVSKKGGFVDKLGQKARKEMNQKFIDATRPQSHETILDVGASAFPSYHSSNYLESNHADLNITAVGIGHTNPIWETYYPSIPYVNGSALELPFEDNSFDIVYSHAVIEHVGCFANQVTMIAEAIRVARKAVWITTPNRWHPVEVHTVLPLMHWLPKHLHRSLLKKLGKDYFADEANLNLLDKRTLNQAVFLNKQQSHAIANTYIHQTKFCGFTANLLLHIVLK